MTDDARLLEIQTIAPHHMASIMQAALIDSSRSSTCIIDCILQDYRQRDGHRGATQYEVHLGGPDVTSSSRQLVSALTLGGPRTRRLWRQLEEADLPDVIPGTGLRPFAYSPDLDVLFQVFPYDARLPALRQLVPHPSPEVATVLDDDFASQKGERGSWRGEIARYRPDMRATVRLDRATSEGSNLQTNTRYFAKVFRDPAQAQHAFLMQDSLYQSLETVESWLQVARPIALATSYRTLVTAAIAGVPLDRILKRSHDPIAHLRAAARAIAALHQLPASAPIRPVTTEVARIHKSGQTVIATYPRLEPRVAKVVETVTSGLTSAPASFVHGDLKPEHILADKDGRIAIIDFDLSVIADPMIDIAHFIAFLEKSAARSRTRTNEHVSPITVFLDEYFAHASGNGLPRLRLYHAATAVHRAAGLCRTSSTENSHQAEQVLDEAMRFVSGELAATAAPTFKRRMTRGS